MKARVTQALVRSNQGAAIPMKLLVGIWFPIHLVLVGIAILSNFWVCQNSMLPKLVAIYLPNGYFSSLAQATKKPLQQDQLISFQKTSSFFVVVLFWGPLCFPLTGQIIQFLLGS